MQRTGSAIQAYSGQFVWPADLRPEDIRIEDVAHALAHQCRYSGHTERFYSVAQHSVLCAIMAPEEHRKWALLHDAGEAYLVDIPRPIKKMIPGIYALEQQIDRAVALRFNLPWPRPEIIQEIDDRMLATEATQLLKVPAGGFHASPHWFGPDTFPTPYNIKIVPWTPEQAEAWFLQFYEGGAMSIPLDTIRSAA